MPRYFFDLEECGTFYEDEEGRECRDLDAARALAVHEARQIMSDEVKAGRLCLGCRLDVRDSARELIFSLPFREALQVSGLR